jgi:hypothetical protein
VREENWPGSVEAAKCSIQLEIKHLLVMSWWKPRPKPETKVFAETVVRGVTL